MKATSIRLRDEEMEFLIAEAARQRRSLNSLVSVILATWIGLAKGQDTK